MTERPGTALDTKTGRLCYIHEGISYRLPTCYDLYKGKNPKPKSDDPYAGIAVPIGQ